IRIEGSIPLPPRRRWLRRITLILLVLVTVAAGTRVWWGHFADRRVAAFLAEAKARGEPSSSADLKSSPVPQEKNGAILVAEAALQFHLNDDQYEFLRANNLWLDVPFRSQPVWDRILSDIAPSLRLVRESRSRPSLHSIHEVDRDVEHDSLKDAALADVLSRLASQEWQAGDLESSFNHILDIVQIGDAMRADSQLYDMFWKSLDVDASALQATVQFAQPGKMQLDLVARNPDLYRKRIRDFIALLSDERELRHAFETTCYSEGLRDIRRAGFNSNSIEAQWMMDELLEPSARIEAVRSARRHFALARLANQPDISFDSGMATLPPRDEKQGPNLRSWLITDERMGPWPEGMLATYCRFLAYRRISAVAMALHLYALDHRGILPTKLVELVPTYLPAIPDDPSAAGYQSFKCVVNAAGRATVYCPIYRIYVFVGNWQSK
ncbi:MAG TPA: hypothetical protein VFW23_02915, partial [Tepidisphaeraceae bacterium]|nr:hypothetical protein [Tepidisphaeraceae bacterium]